MLMLQKYIYIRVSCRRSSSRMGRAIAILYNPIGSKWYWGQIANRCKQLSKCWLNLIILIKKYTVENLKSA